MADIVSNTEDKLFESISQLIEDSRKQIVKAVNTTMVYTYYGVGQYIVEFEQEGNTRAAYGKGVLKRLSERLTEKYGPGWSYTNLTQFRAFYLTYSNLLTVSENSDSQNLLTVSEELSQPPKIGNNAMLPVHRFTLGWSHYLILMRIDNPQARSFYEIEAHKQQWSVRQLQRQVGSSLYERLALSRDKDEVMRLATEGQTLMKPSDIIKDPLVLEFVGLKPDSSYSEADLEKAIIDKLQNFLMECGKGFLFEARQKRFTFDEDYFYVDLVLYNRILQCYVLVDLKMGKLTHQDLGQMQMYVNYFDRFVRLEFEKPTIGILLCEQKNNSIVELTLPKDANIYAQQYALCLPNKEELQNKLSEWVTEFEEINGNKEDKR